ncbi:MAG: hypothetical protein FWD61_08815 [Phycisphaerales bacterium]|nr:hypothetical protein [Phycisphaerales bacterium]
MHRFVIAMLALFTLLSCQHAATQPSNSSTELRGVLADLANSHNDKIKLALWVSTPFRPVEAPFRPFFNNMGTQNKQLLAELQTWAKQHKVDLTYHPPTGFAGAVDKIMNARQEKLVRNDDKLSFQHHILIQMYIDYENNLSQCQALLPTLTDPALKSHIERTAKMYSDGSAEILALLARYKFQ